MILWSWIFFLVIACWADDALIDELNGNLIEDIIAARGQYLQMEENWKPIKLSEDVEPILDDFRNTPISSKGSKRNNIARGNRVKALKAIRATSELRQTTTSSTISGDTVTVNLAASDNSTAFVGGFTVPSSSLTPVPEPTNLILQDVSFEFLDIEVNATSYVMGSLLPITRSGKPWLAGVQYVEAFKCQLNILNSNTRILPQSLVTYLIQNSDVTITNATQQALLLQNQDTFMVVGPAYDDQIPSVGYLYGPQNSSFVSFDSSSINVANSTIFPSFFRTMVSDNFQARAMAETMKIFGWTFVAALFTTDSYGQSGRTALLSQTGRQRIKVTCNNSINPGSTSGLVNFADCVAQSEASVVVLWMDEENAANALSVLYRNATNSRLTFIASDRWAILQDPEAFNTTVVERTNSSFPLSLIEGTVGFIPQIGQLGQYRACASQVTPDTVDYPEFLPVWEEEFRCRWNSTEDLPQCPTEVAERTEECSCTGEEDFSTLPVDRLVNYVQDSVNIMYQALNALFSPSKCTTLKTPSICNLTDFSPSDYVAALSKVSLTGLTGSVQFNVTQPDRRRSNLDIYQFREDGEAAQIGFWNITGPYLGRNLLQFKTSPAYPVSILVPENTNFDSGFWPAMVAILSAIGLLVAISMAAFFTVFASSRVVKRTNLAWIWLMYSGIACVFLSQILWTINQTTLWCTMKSIIGMLGFALITSSIAVKVQRVFRVLINTGNVSMLLKMKELVIVMAIALTPSIILIIVYTIASGELPTATVTQSTVDNTYVYITCTPTSTSFNNWVVGLFIAYNILLLLASTLVMFLSRHLETAYQEAEFIFLCLLDFVLLCVIMIPLYYTVGDRKGSVLQTFLLRSLAVVFAMYLTMTLVFFPKFNAVMAHRKARKEKEEQADGSEGGSMPMSAAQSAADSSDSDIDYSAVSTIGKPKFISQIQTHPSAASRAESDGSQQLDNDGNSASGSYQRSGLHQRSNASRSGDSIGNP